MNEGQERFFNFIMERVMDGKHDEAKALLNQGFEKQADGTFDMAFINEFSSKLFPIIKPEFAEEVKSIITNDGPRHIRK
ncbi:MAG: hypothetical protein ACOYVK_04720 [Bacillota bacterium]